MKQARAIRVKKTGEFVGIDEHGYAYTTQHPVFIFGAKSLSELFGDVKSNRALMRQSESVQVNYDIADEQRPHEPVLLEQIRAKLSIWNDVDSEVENAAEDITIFILQREQKLIDRNAKLLTLLEEKVKEVRGFFEPTTDKQDKLAWEKFKRDNNLLQEK